MKNDTTVFVGLDVHKDSITVAAVGSADTDPVIEIGRIGTRHYDIERLLKRLSGMGRPRIVYEAGPCGFWLQRLLREKGIECVVVAPSLIPKRPGDRVKTDRRDAHNLALAFRAGTLTPVHIPTPEEEAFRDIVRAWQQSKRDVTAGRQRLKSFLLRHDVRYSGRAKWSQAHRRWLSELVMDQPPQQIVLQELIEAISERERRRDRLEAQMDQLAPGWSGFPLAKALQAFRGIQKTVAYTVVSECVAFDRFAHPSQLMAWLGLVPSEHSSGSTRRQGPITRCGNRWARTLLVEAAWAYRYPAKVSRIIEKRSQEVDPEIRALAWKAQVRLCQRHRRLAARGKHSNVVTTAIARELAAFIWDAARHVPRAA